ncbi:MAG: PqqD family protein [Desulfobacterales bacterium]|nr:PqqD family protein [Desulfobacterales bacterium]MDJ0888613.1 PqqD family protein [Desulfobacterales bacterium]MDJ0990835.1 PqqD family protein [Desulfobacterales bacterium]
MRLFPKKQRRAGLTRENALQCVPVKNSAVREIRLENGLVRLCYPLPLKPWLAELRRRFGPPETTPPEKQIELDELGTLTWDLMDGTLRFSDIVRRFSRRAQVHPKEAEAAVAQFIRELGRRGLVGLKNEP